MPFHKKTFKKIKKFVKKANPFSRLRKALKPKKKAAVRGATKAPSRVSRRTKAPRRSTRLTSRRRPRR